MGNGAALRRQCSRPSSTLQNDIESGTYPSRTACRPVKASHRRTITSQYLGSNSITRAWRPAFSHAITVVPLPPNGSRIVSRALLLFRSARSTNSRNLEKRALDL
jgi:hypothetical protein